MIIGLTGGIGSGKSAAAEIFIELGIDVIDTDFEARNALKKGSNGYNLFIKQFKHIFKKIITIPIENESGSMKANDLYRIAIKNKLNVEKASNFNEALKKISSKEKKVIVCFGSLYNVGNILNKN